MSPDVDWNAALATVHGDRRLLKLVIKSFLAESLELQNQISTAMASEDAKLLHRTAHTFKGTMNSLGAVGWSHTARRLEEIGATGSTAGAQVVAEKLNQELPSLLEQLTTFSEEQSD